MTKKYEKKKRKGKERVPQIKELVKSNKIQNILDEDYPLFCFKYLNDTSIKECRDSKFFCDFLSRLQKLSELGWNEIRGSHKHGFGMEPLPRDKIKPSLPSCITPDVDTLHVFRANGNNLPFVGLQIDRIFRIFFIETNFGDIYDHD